MRPAIIILLACLTSGPAFSAEDSGERSYPADDRTACMERDVDTSRGGCLTREDGSARAMAPQPLPPAPDTTRQSPTDTATAERRELPGTSSDR